jgi:putative Holliday junction resolvase
MIVLAVDHGEKRIGIAVSDSSGKIARPLTIIKHISRVVDAAQIASLAVHYTVELIIVGQSFDEEGLPNQAGHRAERFVNELRSRTEIPIKLWDEALSTQDAKELSIAVGRSRKKRAGHLDDLAATIILQSYLEARSERDR